MKRIFKDVELLQNIGQVIRAKRMAKGWSGEEFASKCGLDRTYVIAVERGRNIGVVNLYAALPVP